MILFQGPGPSIGNFKRVSLKTGLRVLFWELKSKIIIFYPKISYEGLIFKISICSVFLQLANKKNIKHFKFLKIGGFTGVLNNRVFSKKYQRF